MAVVNSTGRCPVTKICNRQKLMQKKKGSETESKALVKAFQYFNLSGNNMVDCRCFARTVERFGVVLEAAEFPPAAPRR